MTDFERHYSLDEGEQLSHVAEGRSRAWLTHDEVDPSKRIRDSASASPASENSRNRLPEKIPNEATTTTSSETLADKTAGRANTTSLPESEFDRTTTVRREQHTASTHGAPSSRTLNNDGFVDLS